LSLSIREVSIREAVPGDYGELARLMTDAYQEFADFLGEDWEGYRDDLADVARRAALGTQLVAETAGRMVGTVTYYPPQDQAHADEWTWWPKGFAYLRALGVHPEARVEAVRVALEREDEARRRHRRLAAGGGEHRGERREGCQAHSSIDSLPSRLIPWPRGVVAG